MKTPFLWIVSLMCTIGMPVVCAAQAEQILHYFGSKDGSESCAGLSWDTAGNLYGTNGIHETKSAGNVFELSPQPGGLWKYSLLHSFAAFDGDGSLPCGAVSFDGAGNLYGTTLGGGVYNHGTVYQLFPSGGRYKYKIIWSFSGTNHEGEQSYSTPAIDAAGNLYGVTWVQALEGGRPGSVWELSPQAGGSWSETILYTLRGKPGVGKTQGVVFGPGGNLFGASFEGGVNGEGTVFELSPKAGGGWRTTVLYSFGQASSTDGSFPEGITFDSQGNLFGTTSAGGTHNFGILYELPSNGNGILGARSNHPQFRSLPRWSRARHSRC
ncbi:MAG: hypothetical protein H0X25_11795 [Acidobacteriales bacterium]|nr:hypothetical protein [Terriglobales bacterium]